MEYHFAPDFLNLLIETIARLNRSKKDVLMFFRGAGAPGRYLDDLAADLRRDKDSHNKFGLARTVLVRLNEAADTALATRREVVKRIVEFEDFTRCWDKDVLEAKGLVSEVRRLVNVKDSFTRMNIERQREQEQVRSARTAELEVQRHRREQFEHVKRALFALFAESSAYDRAKALEGVLNQLFLTFGLLIREAFTVRVDGLGVVEQIDGAIELDGHLYLVEVKWWSAPLGTGETAQHLVRVFSRDGARGLFISATGFTSAAVDQYRQALAQKVAVLCTLEEIVNVLNAGLDFADHLRDKVRAAVLDKNPFVIRGRDR
jgi:restriction system protein